MKEEHRHHSSQSGQGRRHHHHHHRHHSRLKHRLKRWLRRHKWTGVAIAMALVLLMAAGLWMRRDARSRAGYNVMSTRQVDVGGGYRSIQYNGKSYRYNNRVTSILYAGIDSEEDIQAKCRVLKST